MEIYDFVFGIFDKTIGVFVKKNDLSDYLWYDSLESVYDKIKSYQVLEPTISFEYCATKITANQAKELREELKTLIKSEAYNGVLFWIDYEAQTINANYRDNLLRSKHYLKSLKESFADIAYTGVTHPIIKFGIGFTMEEQTEMNAELKILIEENIATKE